MKPLPLSILIALMWFAPQVGAAIVATSLSSPFTLHNQLRSEGDSGIDIDIDGDGVRDFFTTDGGGECGIVPTGENRIMAFRVPPPDLERLLAAMVGGEAIGPEPEFGTWFGLADRNNTPFDNGSVSIYRCNGRVPVGEPMTCMTTISPDWDVISYIGVEWHKDGNVHYGWIGINAVPMSTNHTVNVHGWAYESEPGRYIAAGAIPEPGAGLLSLSAAGFSLFRRRRRA